MELEYKIKEFYYKKLEKLLIKGTYHCRTIYEIKNDNTFLLKVYTNITFS